MLRFELINISKSVDVMRTVPAILIDGRSPCFSQLFNVDTLTPNRIAASRLFKSVDICSYFKKRLFLLKGGVFDK